MLFNKKKDAGSDWLPQHSKSQQQVTAGPSKQYSHKQNKHLLYSNSLQWNLHPRIKIS